MASETEQNTNDDMISLEDLVRDSAAEPAVALSVAEIDKVLEVEAPEFAAEAQALKDAGSASEATEATAVADVALDEDVDHLLAKEKAEKASKGWKKIRLWLIVKPWRKLIQVLSSLKAVWPWLKLTAFPAAKIGAQKTVSGSKAGLTFVLSQIKSVFAWFGKQPKQSKLLIISVVVLAAGALAMTRIVLHGSFLPSLGREFLVSFNDEADEKFKFEKDEKWQDLNDPLLHPEHIVLVERLIVNLRSDGDSNPMALMDLYVEASSQEAAVEIKDRDSEIRDMVLRTMEQMNYDELVTDTGKNKLKIFLRKNLNEMMSRGRVRRLFFKSIVLKP